MKRTIKGKVVAIQEGTYTNYVIQNLSELETSELRYLTLTKCPNWQSDKIEMYDIGFFIYEYAAAGETYIDISSGETKQYKYSANYFMNFISEQTKDKNEEFNF